MALIDTDHWRSNTYAFIEQHLRNARERLRIATGFFSIEGYDLIRSRVASLKVDILVGYDEHSHERLREMLIDDIMVHLSRWDTENRRFAVHSLVGKLQRRELRIHERLDARVRKHDHAKVYLIDDRLAFSGSANLTRSGLINNSENLAVVLEPERVRYWCLRFEENWTAPDTQDLSQLLLDALLAWMGLRSPYDVYLKTVEALIPADTTEPPRASYKMPVAFQQVVIERALRQLREWRGSFIVASTGLGKTVMATHTALRLFQEKKILNAIIFAPQAVHTEWKNEFRTAGISAEIITRNLLDQPKRSAKRGKVDAMEDALRLVDDRTLIILDETQYFVNRLKARGDEEVVSLSVPGPRQGTRAPTIRESFKRIVSIANSSMPYVLLLTATPLVKEADDLNNQLHLLPHRAAPNAPDSRGQTSFMSRSDTSPGNPWEVIIGGNHFEQFMNLPVVTVISTSYVSKTFSTHTERGDYVEFGTELRWIPRIELHRVRVPLPVEHELGQILDKRVFRHKRMRYRNRGKWTVTEAHIENLVSVAWASSPAALADVLDSVINDRFHVEFILDKPSRAKSIQPVLDAVRAYAGGQDVKLRSLINILHDAKRAGKKTIVFSERHATCCYLEEQLATLAPDVSVANAVRRVGSSKYEQRDGAEVQDLIIDFAPEANRDRIDKERPKRLIDVLILTDAYGVGVNLQDASVVVDYDLAWTPDVLTQRAGRVLRFWREPRKVQFFIFVGEYSEYREGQDVSLKVESRLQVLTERGRQADQYTELPSMPASDSAEYASLAELSAVDYDVVTTVAAEDIEEFSGVSRFLNHITELRENSAYAATIPNDISSARAYDGSHDLIYVLLRHRDVYDWIVVDLVTNQEVPHKGDEDLLDMLACTPDTPVEAVSPDQIELLAQLSRARWAKNKGIENTDEIERVCALYLSSRKRKPKPDTLLRSAVVT